MLRRAHCDEVYMKELEELNEKEIILKATTDYEAFDYIYEKYMPLIFKYVMYRIYSRETAEDIVSIVFTKAMKNLSLFKWRKLPFSAWLYRIAYNEVCNHLKKESKLKHTKKILTRDFEIDETYEDDYSDPNPQSFAFIHQFIQQLPVKDQDLITMRYFERRSFPEISQIKGKNESTVRVNLYRALKKLEHLIPKEVYNEAFKQISM